MKNITNIQENSSKENKVDLRDTLKIGAFYWKFFLLGTIIAISLAFVYLKFATYNYEVSSTILINDEDNDGGSTSEIAVFQDLGLFSGPKTSLDTEIGILKSKTLIERVIRDLGLNISYYTANGMASKEIHKNELPIKIDFFFNDLNLNTVNTSLTIKSISNSQYDLIDSDGKKIITGNFGEKTAYPLGDILVARLPLTNQEQIEIFIKISPLEEIAIAFKNKIEITQDNPKSNLLILKLKDPIKFKAREILDSLVSYYNQDAINYKNLIANNTNEFLNNRIKDVSVELTGWDEGVESYKEDNKLSNIEYESNISLASNATISNQIVELNSQIKLIDFLINYMKTNEGDLIPDNLGGLDASVSQNVTKYNNLVLDRKRLLKGANSQNPLVISLNDQITSLRGSIDRSLINQRSSIAISLNEAKRQENKLDSRLFSTPKQERDLKVISRQQEIIETLYLYLLQKREENSISSAITVPYAIIIDKAYGSSIPVSPRKLIVIASSLLLGVLIPGLVIMLSALFNNRINRYEDIESLINAPLIGDIPKTKFKKGIVPFTNKKSVRVAESFRLLRTNITHSFSNQAESNKTIFITSTTCEEGKTYIASNLATSFALLNKSVLLLETNIKNPKIVDYLSLKSGKGLSDFLIDEKVEVTDLIKRYEKHGFDIIEAGSIVKKSSELLTKPRFEEILNYSTLNYDYVIVDTPAINENSDTLMLAHHADMFLYVIRANTLTHKMLNVPKTLFRNKRLPKMNIVMTDTDYKKLGYDYGNALVKQSLWTKIFR